MNNKKILMPIIKDVDPNILASDICSVQIMPIYDPIEDVWIIQDEYGSTKKISKNKYENLYHIFKSRYDKDE